MSQQTSLILNGANVCNYMNELRYFTDLLDETRYPIILYKKSMFEITPKQRYTHTNRYAEEALNFTIECTEEIKYTLANFFYQQRNILKYAGKDKDTKSK